MLSQPMGINDTIFNNPISPSRTTEVQTNAPIREFGNPPPKTYDYLQDVKTEEFFQEKRETTAIRQTESPKETKDSSLITLPSFLS